MPWHKYLFLLICSNFFSPKSFKWLTLNTNLLLYSAEKSSFFIFCFTELNFPFLSKSDQTDIKEMCLSLVSNQLLLFCVIWSGSNSCQYSIFVLFVWWPHRSVKSDFTKKSISLKMTRFKDRKKYEKERAAFIATTFKILWKICRSVAYRDS